MEELACPETLIERAFAAHYSFKEVIVPKCILSAITVIFMMTCSGLVMAQNTAASTAASADVKVGLSIEKMEIKGESSNLKVPAETRIYVWANVTGVAGSKINIVYFKGDKEVWKFELPIGGSPWHTNAYRIFRAGDSGEWTAKIMSADGKELGKATFTVEITK